MWVDSTLLIHHLWMDTCVCVCAQALVKVDTRCSYPVSLLNYFSTLLFRQVSSLNVKLKSRPGLLSSVPRGSSCLRLLQQGRRCPTTPDFGAGGEVPLLLLAQSPGLISAPVTKCPDKKQLRGESVYFSSQCLVHHCGVLKAVRA